MKPTLETPLKISLFWDNPEYAEDYEHKAWVNGVPQNLDYGTDNPENFFTNFICETFHDELKELKGRSSGRGSDVKDGYYGISFITSDPNTYRKTNYEYVEGCKIELHGGFSAYSKILKAIGYDLKEVRGLDNECLNYEITPCEKVTIPEILETKTKALKSIMKGINKEVHDELKRDPQFFDGFTLRMIIDKYITSHSSKLED